jgi:pyruvate,orthophosphate dikinase
VSGCAAIKIDFDKREMQINQLTLKEGDLLTLDGSSGEVIKGKVPTITAALDKNFNTLMTWVDEVRVLEVRTNADTPQDAKTARHFGAEGIGLCRTEHMFFDADRIDAVREMILSDTRDGRERALTKILPMQKSDFKALFKEMRGYPVTIRLLDPPLHEFIPHSDEELHELSHKTGILFDRLKRKRDLLHEFNPMLGHRGCRLAISFPEIYRTQVQAIFEAACEVSVELKTSITPEVMIPLVGDVKELEIIRTYCIEVAEKVIERTRQHHPQLKMNFKPSSKQPVKCLSN